MMMLHNAINRLSAVKMQLRTVLALSIAPWLRGDRSKHVDAMAETVEEQADLIERLTNDT